MRRGRAPVATTSTGDSRHLMHNAFGTIVAIGIVASGFLLTGDLGWCVRQVSGLFHRADGPLSAEVASSAGPSSSPTAEPTSPLPTPLPPPPLPPLPPRSPDAKEPAVAPRRPVPRPPGKGVDQVDLAQLALGQRVVIWTGATGREPLAHVLELLDSTSGEALLLRRTADGDGPTRRVLVAAGSPAGAVVGSKLSRRGTLLATPIGLAHGTAAAVETLGPIVALTVE